jgi:hypothetical protein
MEQKMEKYIKTEIDRVELNGMFLSQRYIDFLHKTLSDKGRPAGSLLLCHKDFAKDVLHIKWANPFYQENIEDAVPV